MASNTPLMRQQDEVLKTTGKSDSRARGGVVRDALWDNSKGVCQLFVISMHTAGNLEILSFGYEQEIPFKLFSAFQMWIGIFTMPVYCFISGMFTSATPSRKHMVATLRLAAAFLISHVMAMIFTLNGEHLQELIQWKSHHPGWNVTTLSKGEYPPGWFPVKFFQFGNVDWYIWCVVLWRLLLPVLGLLRYPLAVSFALAGMVYFTDADWTTYTCCPFLFMPYFIAGFLWKEKQQDLKASLKNRKLQVAFVALSVIASGACAYNDRILAIANMPLTCMYAQGALDDVAMDADRAAEDALRYVNAAIDPHYNQSVADPPLFPDMHSSCESIMGMSLVLVYYATSFFSLYGFFSIMPERELWLITKAGANSLYIYLLQMFFAVFPLALLFHIFVSWHGNAIHSWLGVPIVLGTAALAWACLAQDLMKRLFSVCIEPPVERCIAGTSSV